MTRFQQTIYLEPDEEITSIIDRLNKSEEINIVLVIPKGADIFQSIINLKLLKREVDNLGKNLIIITSDQVGRHLAEKVGIPIKDRLEIDQEVFPSLPASQSMEEVSIKKPTIGKMVDIISPIEQVEKPEPKRTREIEYEPLQPKEIKPDEYWSEVKEAPKEYLRHPTGQVRPMAEKETAEIDLSQRPMEEVTLEIKEPSEVKPHKKFFDFLRRKKERKIVLSRTTGKLFLVFIALGVITFGLVAYFVLPKAKLVIALKKESILFDLPVLVDKNTFKIDLMLNKIPGRLIKTQSQETREFPATGERQLDEKARGLITVYNEYSSSPQTLVETTRFLSTETGKVFKTTKTIVVPGAKIEEGKIVPNSINVEVIADEPSPEYNIGPSNFTIPGFKGTAKYNGFYGKSKTAMSGGSIGKVKIVSKEDLEKAKESLAKELREKIIQSLKNQVPTNFKLFNEALKEETIETVFSQQAGERAEKFTLNLKNQATAIVFDPRYIDELVDKNIISQISEKKKVLPNAREINYTKWQVNFDKGQIGLDIKVKQGITWEVNISDLKKELAGKNESEIKKILSQKPEIQNIQVIFWPFWVKRIPEQTSKIEIIID